MSLKVLISGGGIAGPALAFWLARLGHKCTVVERFPSLRAGGQQIDLKAQGIDAIKYMGLTDEVRKHVVDEAGLCFVDSEGKEKARFVKRENNRGRGFTSEFEIMRGDLCKVLYEATRESVEYRFGVTVDTFEDVGEKVRVKLSDGTEDNYDLLVGADGQESRIRKKIIGEEVNKASIRSLGVFANYYLIDRESTDEQVATAYNATRRRVLSTRYHNDTHGQAYMLTMGNPDQMREAMKKDIAAQKDAFAKEFSDAGWQAERLVAAMYKAEDFYSAEIIQVRSPTWSKRRVVLLGDAGYAPSPLTGMGTTIALMGAHILAGELSRQEDVLGALKEYEAIFRPFVEKTQALPKGIPGLVYPESMWGIKVIHALLGFASAIKLDKAVEWYTEGKGKDGWQLPPPPKLAGEMIQETQGNL